MIVMCYLVLLSPAIPIVMCYLVFWSPAIPIQPKAFIGFLELLLSANTDEVDLIGPAGWVLFSFKRGDEKGFSI
jgi:hypothetical protein